MTSRCVARITEEKRLSLVCAEQAVFFFIFLFPVRHVRQDADRSNRLVWLLGTVGLHTAVEGALSAA